MTGEDNGKYRALSPWLDRVVKSCGIVLVAVAALYSLNLHGLLGFAFFPQQFLGLVLGLALFEIFMLIPPSRRQARSRLPWYDAVLAGLGLTCGLYVVIWFPVVAYQISFPTADKYVLGGIAVVLVLEACRRVYGPALSIVTLGFIVYALFASHFPGIFESRSISMVRLNTELFLGPSGVLGIVLALVATVVLVFILFGQLLFAMGGGTIFTDLASALLGRYRGGPAKVAVVGSALFGSISGSAVANVAITGTVTIPMMKRLGFRPAVAGAVEATASTGGLVTPPVMSVVAFAMAELLQVPYREIVIAATLPAVLYYAAILVQVDLEAGRMGMKGLPRSEIPRILDVLRRGWPFLLPIPVLLYTLIGLFWEPAKAGMFAVLVLLVTGFWFVRDKRLAWWYEVLARIGVSAVELISIGALIGLILGVADATGLGFTLSLPLLAVSDVSTLLFLSLTAVISIVLGMGLPGIAIYFMQVTLIIPALLDAGILPIAAHFFIYYFGVFSFITPPVCISAIAAAGIAGAEPMRTGWESMKLGVVAFLVPFMFVFSPGILGQGPFWLTVADTASAGFGVLVVSAGLRGFFRATIGGPMRLVLVIAAVALWIPLGVFPAAWIVNLAGLVVGAAVLGANHAADRATERASAKFP